MKFKSVYPQLVGKSRSQVIEIASQEVKKVLKDIDLREFRHVSASKSSKYFRVRFDTNIAIPTQNENGNAPAGIISKSIGSEIIFTSSEQGDEVMPKESKFLFRLTDEIRTIANTFAIGDRLSFTDNGDAFVVRVSHPSTASHSGGFEKYSINKKTKEREMIQHEHPQAFGKMIRISGADGKDYVDLDPEIEIPDPAFPSPLSTGEAQE